MPNLRKLSPLGLLGVLVLAGCRQDMHDQPRFKPLAKSDFYADMRSARAPVEGTVSAHDPLRAEDPNFYDAYFQTGYVGNVPGDYMPFAVDAEVLSRGQQRFNIYCAPCHSRVGDGNGMVAQRGFRPPPSYHTDRLRKAPLGYLFGVISNGFGAMPDYAGQIPPRDRWAIVAYVKALQLSQSATMNDVPKDQKLPSAPVTFEGEPGSGATQPDLEPLETETEKGSKGEAPR